MVKFSRDVDLFKWEPVLFRELYLKSQTLCQGIDGQMSGTTFTSASGSFINCAVAAGHVIYVRDGEAIDSGYEVVSVDSPTQLTVSMIRESAEDDPMAVPSGSDLEYRISTFDPQAEEAAYALLQYFGIKLSGSDNDITADEILENRALRQASVYAVLSAVLTASSCGQKDPAGYWQKSLHYQKLYHAARSRVRLELDTDEDGFTEQYRSGGAVRLRRL